MTFMHDQLSDSRSCRLFNVIDADISLPAERVIHSLDHIIEWRSKPKKYGMGIGGITPIQKLKLTQRKSSTSDFH